MNPLFSMGYKPIENKFHKTKQVDPGVNPGVFF